MAGDFVGIYEYSRKNPCEEYRRKTCESCRDGGLRAGTASLSGSGMTWVRPHVLGISRRGLGDFLLFGVTSAELVLLFFLTSTFTIADWVYVSQHLLVLGIALTRPPPQVQERSLLSSTAVVVAYAYPYAQVVYLRWVPGNSACPVGGLVLVPLAWISTERN